MRSTWEENDICIRLLIITEVTINAKIAGITLYRTRMGNKPKMHTKDTEELIMVWIPNDELNCYYPVSQPPSNDERMDPTSYEHTRNQQGNRLHIPFLSVETLSSFDKEQQESIHWEILKHTESMVIDKQPLTQEMRDVDNDEEWRSEESYDYRITKEILFSYRMVY